MLADENRRQGYSTTWACDRVAAAWAMKRSAHDKDLARKRPGGQSRP
jgi:hypothetical protein